MSEGRLTAAQRDSREVEPAQSTTRRGQGAKERRAARRMGMQTAVVREINRTAEERLAARLDSAPHPNVEHRTTKRLGELFDDRRSEQAGTLTDPYGGRTMGAGRGR